MWLLRLTMALPEVDTAAGFSSGDEVRLCDALGIGISESTLTGIINCMNQLTGFSPATVAVVLGYLSRWDTAKGVKQAADVANTESKMLIKADVLEWEAKGGGLVGLEAEIATCIQGIQNCFEFCPYVNTETGGYSTTQLIRS